MLAAPALARLAAPFGRVSRPGPRPLRGRRLGGAALASQSPLRPDAAFASLTGACLRPRAGAVLGPRFASALRPLGPAWRSPRPAPSSAPGGTGASAPLAAGPLAWPAVPRLCRLGFAGPAIAGGPAVTAARGFATAPPSLLVPWAVALSAGPAARPSGLLAGPVPSGRCRPLLRARAACARSAALAFAPRGRRAARALFHNPGALGPGRRPVKAK